MDPQQRLLLKTTWEAFEEPESTRGRCTAANRRVRRGDRHDYASRRRPTPTSRVTARPAPRAASCPAAWPTCSAWRARRSRSTPRARRRWWPCTWRCRRCAAASATLALAGGVDRHGDPRAVRGVQPPARAGPRRPVQGIRCRRRRHRLGRGRGRAGVRAAVRRRAQRSPGAGASSAARPSTRTVPSNGLTAPNGPSQQRVIRAGAGQRRTRPGRRRRGRGATAPAPSSAIRSRRRRCWPPTARTGRRAAAVARLGQVEHRPHPGAAGVAGVIKMVMAMRHGVAAADAARRRADPARRLVGRRGVAADRGAAVAGGGRPRRAGGLVLRHQRHQRPCRPGGGTGRARRGRSRRSPRTSRGPLRLGRHHRQVADALRGQAERLATASPRPGATPPTCGATRWRPAGPRSTHRAAVLGARPRGPAERPRRARPRSAQRRHGPGGRRKPATPCSSSPARVRSGRDGHRTAWSVAGVRRAVREAPRAGPVHPSRLLGRAAGRPDSRGSSASTSCNRRCSR